MIAIRRIYDPDQPAGAKRYLVDRVWPRGISKDKAALDDWLKDLAPSTELREWFHHEADKWEEFKRRFRQELSNPEAARLADRLRREARERTVLLLYAAREEEHNNAVALKAFLENGEI